MRIILSQIFSSENPLELEIQPLEVKKWAILWYFLFLLKNFANIQNGTFFSRNLLHSASPLSRTYDKTLAGSDLWHTSLYAATNVEN